MPEQKQLRFPVSEDTVLDCALYVEVRVIMPDRQVYEQYISVPREAVRGIAFGTVGEYLQRTIYDMFHSACMDAYAEQNSIGRLKEEKT